VFNDMTVEQRQKLNFRDVGGLQEYARENCRALYLCRQAATASKHWVVNQHADPEVQVVVTAETEWTVYFVDHGRSQPADVVFEMAFAFWNEFIRDHRIS
jgi:hypothetical protein